MHESTCPDELTAVMMCVGRHSVANVPLLDHVHRIRSMFPAVPLIVLSDREEAEEVIAAFREGVRGYV